MKKSMCVMLVLLFAALVGGVANAMISEVDDFSFFCATWLDDAPIAMSHSVDLMFRDPATGIDSVVSADGYWNMGFYSYSAGMVGWAKDPIGPSADLVGFYYANLGVGNRPDEVFLVHDQNGDGMGTWDDTNGSWELGDDDILYVDYQNSVPFASQNILFGPDEVRGDLSCLPAYPENPGLYLTLPAMTISIVPEPATMSLLALGGLALLRKRK